MSKIEQEALVVSSHGVDEVRAYLPSNYSAMEWREGLVLIYGNDSHGWTMKGYVIPRLLSGNIVARELA